MEKIARPKHTKPTHIALAFKLSCNVFNKKKKLNPIGITAPRTKLGTVVVAVARILVPNCSEAMVTNNAQYPVQHPSKKIKK